MAMFGDPTLVIVKGFGSPLSGGMVFDGANEYSLVAGEPYEAAAILLASCP